MSKAITATDKAQATAVATAVANVAVAAKLGIPKHPLAVQVLRAMSEGSQSVSGLAAKFVPHDATDKAAVHLAQRKVRGAIDALRGGKAGAYKWDISRLEAGVFGFAIGHPHMTQAAKLFADADAKAKAA